MKDTNLTVKEVIEALQQCPEDMPVIIPVINIEDVNEIFEYRYIRTMGILHQDGETDAICLAPAYKKDLSENINSYTTCVKLFY